MKPITRIAIAIFTIVALVHVIRLVFGWNLIINGVSIPLWASLVGAAIAGALAAGLWREAT